MLPIDHSPFTLRQSLTRPLSALSCSFYTATYVGSLYLFRSTRIGGQVKDSNGQNLTRDHPQVVKARMAGVLASSLLSIATTHYWVLKTLDNPTWEKTAALLGFALPSTGLKGVLCTLGLTGLLFLGPLYTSFLDKTLLFQKHFSVQLDLKERFLSLTGLRTFVVGPLSEEIVFRSCVIGTSALSRASRNQLIFVSPLYFGLAHVHHAYEIWHNNGRTRNALIQGILTSVFQFSFTTLFGWYASYLFLRSSSIYPPLAAHVFCNILGFPQLAAALQTHPTRKWSIWLTYISGVVGYVYYFTSWTNVSNVFGGSLYWV